MTKKIKGIEDITPDRQNANRGTKRGAYVVARSLEETGAGRSVLADKDGELIAGNKTIEAWADMGGAVKVVETDGRTLVVVQRTDLDLDSDDPEVRKRSRLAAYYDNRAGEVGLSWDAEVIAQDLQDGLDLGVMFFDGEIEAILGNMPDVPSVPSYVQPGTIPPATPYTGAQAPSAPAGAPFTPNTAPSASATTYTPGDVASAAARLGNQFTGEDDQVSILCPHCGEEFFVNRRDIGKLA